MLEHPRPLSEATYSAVELTLDNRAMLVLDQRLLPEREAYVRVESLEHAAGTIRDMVVRGAPAIGITAAYAMVLAAGAAERDYLQTLIAAGRRLCETRPTAVNLAWAVERCLSFSRGEQHFPHSERVQNLAEFARGLHHQDVESNRALAKLGAAHIVERLIASAERKQPERLGVLTHCNAGALATGGYGTALGVVRTLHALGRLREVLADETRPYLQGARLTAWELARDEIAVSVIVDSSAAWFMQMGAVDCVIVGADRIASNGDVANKIGTYALACLASKHGLPLYVAAPMSTVDFACDSKSSIRIEERAGSEVRNFDGRQLVVANAAVKNPAFDVTPAELVTAIFTEKGVVHPVSSDSMAKLA